MNPIPARPSWKAGQFTLVAASATAQAEWDEFVKQEPRAAKRAFERLTTAPMERIPKRQFPLRGERLRPFWEYEASGASRIYYAVDLKSMTVVVAVRRDVHDGAAVASLIVRRRPSYDTTVKVQEAAVAEALRPAKKN